MNTCKPAGFWIRFLANFIDGIFMSILAWIIATISSDPTYPSYMDGGLFAPLSLSENIANAFYAIVFIIIFTGTTLKGSPGKMICGIQVLNAQDMTQISMLKSIGRFFSYLVSGIILFIGFMMAGWNSEKKALHDMICNTSVVYRNKTDRF